MNENVSTTSLWYDACIVDVVMPVVWMWFMCKYMCKCYMVVINYIYLQIYWTCPKVHQQGQGSREQRRKRKTDAQLTAAQAWYIGRFMVLACLECACSEYRSVNYILVDYVQSFCSCIPEIWMWVPLLAYLHIRMGWLRMCKRMTRTIEGWLQAFLSFSWGACRTISTVHPQESSVRY